MNDKACPVCGCRKSLELTWEHCNIGFPDCGTTLPDTRIKACEKCGVLRVDDYRVGRLDD